MSEPQPHTGFLPDFCSVRTVFGVVVSGELLAAVLTLGSGRVADFWGGFSLTSIFVLWIALVSTALLCPLRRVLNRLGHARAGFIAWLLVMTIALLASEIALLTELMDQAPPHRVFLAQTLGITAIIAALALRYLYEQFREREKELADSQSRLVALQARIRPHFLFNSLNTIAALIRGRPDAAEDALHDLSDLFRASLRGADQTTTLVQELDLVRGYLRLEGHRFGDRLKVVWDLDPALPGDARVPPLLLQPLIENALVHGVEPSSSVGRILISGRLTRGRINLSVRNSIPPRPGGKRAGHGIAMDNIRARLEALWEDRAGLTLGQVDDQYQVRLHFPYQKIQA